MDRLQLQELIAGLGGAVEDFGRAGAVARGGKQDSGAFYQGLAQSAGRARWSSAAMGASAGTWRPRRWFWPERSKGRS
jgi:hypothetical protein